MITELVHQEDITFINVYVPNITPRYIKQILTDLKGEIESNTIIVRDLNTPVTSMDRSSWQTINKETIDLNNTLHQIKSLIGI